jgi:hypothetical protein
MRDLCLSFPRLWPPSWRGGSDNLAYRQAGFTPSNEGWKMSGEERNSEWKKVDFINNKSSVSPIARQLLQKGAFFGSKKTIFNLNAPIFNFLVPVCVFPFQWKNNLSETHLFEILFLLSPKITPFHINTIKNGTYTRGDCIISTSTPAYSF